MNAVDRFTEKTARLLARRSSRRSFVSWLGAALVGAPFLPTLPVARAAEGEGAYPGVAPQPTGRADDPGDPASCEYWRYCAMDGFLCSCCGGSQSSCPPGTEMSPITWVGTCRNPADGLSYIISYNDCCGKPSCGRCLCNNNLRERPMYRPQLNNDTVWCLGVAAETYTCTAALVLGTATDEK